MKLPSGRRNDSQTRPPARVATPATVIALGPKRAMSRGAAMIIPTMMVTVNGSSAAPLGERSQPKDLLQVQVEEEEHRDPRRTEQELRGVGGGEVRCGEDAEPHQGLTQPRLPGHEQPQ